MRSESGIIFTPFVDSSRFTAKGPPDITEDRFCSPTTSGTAGGSSRGAESDQLRPKQGLIFLKTYILNYYEGHYSVDGKPTLYINAQTEDGWECVRKLSGEDAKNALETLLYSEREDI